jgi:hypothetical protein
VILGEETENHKPHPEPYLKALATLGKKASETVVIEDSPNGVISAKAAGCFVIGINTGFTLEELQRAGADHTGTTFKELAAFLEQVHPAIRNISVRCRMPGMPDYYSEFPFERSITISLITTSVK